MKNKIFIILFLIEAKLLFSDVIYLNDGRIIQGKIVRQTITKVEILLQDKQTQIIEKNRIKRIVYISDEDLKKQEENRKKLLQLEEKRKKEEEIRKLEEEQKKQEEERKKLEEERKRLEEEKKIEELKKLEEEKAKKEEEIRKLEEEKKKQEIEFIEIQKKIAQEESVSNFKIQPKFGIGIGSDSTSIKKYFEYYNFYTSFLQSQSSFYVQNFQLQMKSSPFWNWSGSLNMGIATIYKNLELGIFFDFYYQNPSPKFLSIINKSLIQNQQYFDFYSQLQYRTKDYKNLITNYLFKIGTEEYFSFFWNYIFPYLEIGYFQRNFRYEAKLSSNKVVTSINNSITNVFITDFVLENQLESKAIKLGIPFRFLMIFDSEFLFNFDLYRFGVTRITQGSNELNTVQAQLTNFLHINSELQGNFSGNTIKFTWQNKFNSNSMGGQFAYMSLYKTEWITKVNTINFLNLLISKNINIFYFNEIFLMPYSILYKNGSAFKSLKESQTFLEFGIKIQYVL
ncbi:MAG: hypothetical protein ACK4UJ_09205 [Leptonema sp. (in: bacteria)]